MRGSELYLVEAATLNLSQRGRTFHCGAGGGAVAGKEGSRWSGSRSPLTCLGLGALSSETSERTPPSPGFSPASTALF